MVDCKSRRRSGFSHHYPRYFSDIGGDHGKPGLEAFEQKKREGLSMERGRKDTHVETFEIAHRSVDLPEEGHERRVFVFCFQFSGNRPVAD